MEDRIRDAIGKGLAKAGASGIAFAVERPTETAHGDYMTNAALAAAKPLGKNPREVAQMLAEHLKVELGDSVASVEVAGPGFINVALSRAAVTFSVAEADAKGEEWGKGSDEEGRRVVVEYSCPNPFKEMHIGHLMSTIIGEAVSRLIESSGAKVIRDSYGGDIGPHVAKALWALRSSGTKDVANAAEVDEAYARGASAYEADAEAKAEIDALNTALYAGSDAELLSLWQKAREVCLDAFRELYKVLGTKFDYYLFESETAASGLSVVKDGLSKGIFEESEGAVIYPGEKKGLHTLVFITSRGTPTYEAKDLGLAFLKEERIPNDRSLIVTAAEQTGHFKVFLAALSEIAPLVAEKTSHVAHGFMRLSSGKMSSREGNTITARKFLADVVATASEKNPDPLVAEQVAVGAIKYMVLRQSPGQDIVFDPEKSLSLTGDSGPYLQYALVRAKSVLAQEANAMNDGPPEVPYLLERLIMHFPGVVARATREISPNLLVTYLTELAGEWNSFYAQERIVGGAHETHKLMLARAFVNTMQNGLTFLGIPTPEKM